MGWRQHASKPSPASASWMDDIWRKKSPVGRQFEITDEAGHVLLVVPFTEAN